jgi:hypothetical protein
MIYHLAQQEKGNEDTKEKKMSNEHNLEAWGNPVNVGDL